MDGIKKKVEEYVANNDIDKAVKELKAWNITKTDIERLKWRAEIYYSLHKYAYALNDFIQILKIEPENKIVNSKVEMIKEILKFQSLDIYASTNLNKDPWLDD